jgi:hypothetical protein
MLASSRPTLAFVMATLVATFIGCSPKAGSSATDNSLTPLNVDAAVLVLDVNRSLPDGCRRIVGEPHLGLIAKGPGEAAYELIKGSK